MASNEHLKAQWVNPSDVSNILLIIGGDVVQNAFAQGTGKLYTPVCFSFGCVAYSFTTLINILGDGHLLPRPDYPAKVFNLDTGYVRENRSWVLGRLLRDLETQILHDRREDDLEGIRISVFEALENENKPTQFSWSVVHVIGALATLLQLTLAAIPIILDRYWIVMMITVAGTILVQLTGSLPQWRAEKLPNRQSSKINFALTTGNGSQDIIVILGRGNCLNLEELAAPKSPRSSRPWEKFELPPKHIDQEEAKKTSHEQGRFKKTNAYRGIAYGFWITRVMCSALSILWLLLLINVTAIEKHTWYLLGVGAVGMFQNAWLAATKMSSKSRNVPLHLIDTIKTKKVMDGIMDFETTHGLGRSLLEEFFPGELRCEESDWWSGKNKQPYDDKRRSAVWRGAPRPQKPSDRTSTLAFLEHTQVPSVDSERPASISPLIEADSSEIDSFQARTGPLHQKTPMTIAGSTSQVIALGESQRATPPQLANTTS